MLWRQAAVKHKTKTMQMWLFSLFSLTHTHPLPLVCDCLEFYLQCELIHVTAFVCKYIFTKVHSIFYVPSLSSLNEKKKYFWLLHANKHSKINRWNSGKQKAHTHLRPSDADSVPNSGNIYIMCLTVYPVLQTHKRKRVEKKWNPQERKFAKRSPPHEKNKTKINLANNSSVCESLYTHWIVKLKGIAYFCHRHVSQKRRARVREKNEARSGRSQIIYLITVSIISE